MTSIDGLLSQTVLAYTIENLAKDTSMVDWSKIKDNFDHLKDIHLEKLPSDARIHFLIGTDNPFLFKIEEQRYGGKFDPIGHRTALGWICFGPTKKKKAKELSDPACGGDKSQ